MAGSQSVIMTKDYRPLPRRDRALMVENAPADISVLR
jgi:hypothetical protein